MGNFYSSLDNAKTQCKSHEIAIIMGDLNIAVRKERKGNFGRGTRNERRKR